MSNFDEKMEALMTLMGTTVDDLHRLVDTAERNGIIPKEIRIPQWRFNGLPLVMVDTANVTVHGSYPMRPAYPGEATPTAVDPE